MSLKTPRLPSLGGCMRDGIANITWPIGPGASVVAYTPGLVAYQRQKPKLPEPPFLVRMWFIGFILIGVFFVGIAVVLAICVQFYFSASEQRRTEKVLDRGEGGFIATDSTENPFLTTGSVLEEEEEEEEMEEG
ncbi:hypothetical protein DQ04_02471040 [Trypanosoma grayi]|uniref:hypothetical protein n=1 Tax=Trypanosoma grayi TaxID=71804 RepID=UPI0004F48FEE|nr:hypothetical protein DQ04_02471040 [Trypanosoma grayi]KEG11577.1 hypothetical protein DQ04_02471040 [Trypanosoma grayi]